MSASTSKPSLRALMCSISGSFTAASVGIAGAPSVGFAHLTQFGSKPQTKGYSQSQMPAEAVLGSVHDPHPARALARRRPGPPAAGRDRDRAHPAGEPAATGGSG